MNKRIPIACLLLGTILPSLVENARLLKRRPMTVSARETNTEGSNHITFEFLCVVTGVARVRAFFSFLRRGGWTAGSEEINL